MSWEATGTDSTAGFSSAVAVQANQAGAVLPGSPNSQECPQLLSSSGVSNSAWQMGHEAAVSMVYSAAAASVCRPAPPAPAIPMAGLMLAGCNSFLQCGLLRRRPLPPLPFKIGGSGKGDPLSLSDGTEQAQSPPQSRLKGAPLALCWLCCGTSAAAGQAKKGPQLLVHRHFPEAL